MTSNRLTIAHFIPWEGGGGTEIATLRMAEATRGEFRHVAFCLPGAAAVKASFEALGIETLTYLPPEPSLRHATRFYRESAVVARQLRKIKADIAHFAEIKAAYHNSFAAVLARCRLVCHVRNTYPRISLRERISLLPVSAFVFVSCQALQCFALSIPEDEAHVIYDPVDIPPAATADERAAVRLSLGVPPTSSLVGMVARVNPQKDYFTLASAAVEILQKQPCTQFLVVGDNSLVDLNRAHYQEVEERLKELGVAANFIFTGHRDDIPRLISAIDIAVLSTHREGFGLSVAESMAQRKPVVATAVGGLLEVVRDGNTGYLCRHGDSKQLADAILRLIEDPEMSCRLGLAGLEHVRENFSREAFVRQIVKLYSELIPAH